MNQYQNLIILNCNSYKMFTHHASQTEIRQLKVLKERQIRLTLSANKAPAV